jgi:lysyl-tRNA synthetase class II
MKRPVAALCLSALLAAPAQAQSVADRLNDYPTEARGDYVFGCMAANGQTREMLAKCACSIDRIAAILPYEGYVEAETVLALQQVSGERMAIFKTTQMAQTIVAELRRAQAEAELLCF